MMTRHTTAPVSAERRRRRPLPPSPGARHRRPAGLAVPHSRAGGRGLRDLHARPRRAGAHLERRRAADQGLRGRRHHRPAFFALLHAGGPCARLAGLRTARGARYRPFRGRRLARAQGRHALLGERRDQPVARSGRQADRLREAHPRPDAAPPGRRAPARRARSGSACWSSRSRIMRSSCSTPTAASRAGTRRRARSRAIPPHEIIGQHFSAFYRRKTTRPASPRANWRSRPASAASRTKAGACARTARCSGQTSSSPPCTIRAARCAVSPR